MTDQPQIPPEIPLDMQNQMAPGGRFPGTAETVATPVGSDREIRVPIGQRANKHLQLSREEFRARSAQQRAIDAQMDAESPQVHDTDPPTLPTPPPKPAPKRRGRPKGAKGKAPKLAVPKDQPIGRPYPATSPTPVQVPAPTPTDPAVFMEERMERLERGMDKLVAAISVIHNEKANQDQPRDEDEPTAFTAPYEFDDDDDEDDEDVDDEQAALVDVPEPGESCDAPPIRVVADGPEETANLEKGLQELQQMIVKRRPDKAFRFQWAGLTRAAQYNEWPPERRELFDKQFNAIVAHPRFIHQMATFMRGSRSGQCIGNEQIARVCGTVAGFLVVYQLAAAGR